MYLLDTNVCIDFLDGRSAALSRLMEANFGRLTISAITTAELLVGNRKSDDPVGDARKVDKFVAGVDVADFTFADARTYGEIVRGIGVKRKSFDRLIGVQAARLGLTLVTRNARYFADVPGLKIENWWGAELA